jgi:predicted RNase H-like HicB family nuclease
MAAVKTLTAVFQRDDEGYWLVELAEEPRVHTYGRTLAKAREHIIDATALWFEVAPEELDIVEDIRLPEPVKATLELARREREHAQAAQEAAAGATREAARALVKDGRLSVRDAADVLGLSHQRVQQLLAS